MCVLLGSAFIVKLFKLPRLGSCCTGMAAYEGREPSTSPGTQDWFLLGKVTETQCVHSPDVQKGKRMGFCAQRRPTLPEEYGTTCSCLP